MERTCNVDGYLGLLGVGLVEPSKDTGYVRVPVGKVNLWEAVKLLVGQQFAFPEVKAPGYGYIICIGLFNAAESGELMYMWPVKELVDVHEGVIPGVVNGQLVRGVDVSAEVLAKLEEAISATNTSI